MLRPLASSCVTNRFSASSMSMAISGQNTTPPALPPAGSGGSGCRVLLAAAGHCAFGDRQLGDELVLEGPGQRESQNALALQDPRLRFRAAAPGLADGAARVEVLDLPWRQRRHQRV